MYSFSLQQLRSTLDSARAQLPLPVLARSQGSLGSPQRLPPCATPWWALGTTIDGHREARRGRGFPHGVYSCIPKIIFGDCTEPLFRKWRGTSLPRNFAGSGRQQTRGGHNCIVHSISKLRCSLSTGYEGKNKGRSEGRGVFGSKNEMWVRVR